MGGFSLACEWAGVETIAFSEIDPYASRVLQRHWPNVRNYGDVRNFPSLSAWLLTAGVPCQPASVAGKRKGAADDRWLWPQTLTVVENGSYEWLLFENPGGILSLNDGLEFERICASLEGKGYEVQPLVIPACGVGAPHRRNRVWILGHANSPKWRAISKGRNGTNRDDTGGQKATTGLAAPGSDGRAGIVAHANDAGPQGRIGAELRECSSEQLVRSGGASVSDTNSQPQGRVAESWGERDQWAIEPDVGRVANGIPARVDRLRCLGNSIVPSVAYQLIKRMVESEENVNN